MEKKKWCPLLHLLLGLHLGLHGLVQPVRLGGGDLVDHRVHLERGGAEVDDEHDTRIHMNRMWPYGAKDDDEEYLEAEGLDLIVPAVQHLPGLEVNHLVAI